MSMKEGDSSQPPGDHLRLWVVVALVAGLAVGPLIVLTSGPPAGFSGQVVASNCGACEYPESPSQSIPLGKNVSFEWSDQSGGRVDFRVVGPPTPGGGRLGPTICNWRNMTGEGCSFSSVGGNYSFPAGIPLGFSSEGNQVVNYNGIYEPAIV